ncbi:hypothetical protein NTJ89_002194 [Enterococcus hirae]|nr:hypothetical protein [Enterococcus hirae]
MEFIQLMSSFILKITPFLSWIVAPIATYFITRWLQKRDNNKEFKKASKKIVTLLKPIILEEKKITSELIDSLIQSVSRSEDIEINRMEPPESILDDLILDLIDSSFITNDKKMEISETILDLKKEIVQQKESQIMVERQKSKLKAENLKASKMRMILLLTITSVYLIMLILIITFYTYVTPSEGLVGGFFEKQQSLNPLEAIIYVLATAITVSAAVSSLSLRAKNSLKRLIKKKEKI